MSVLQGSRLRQLARPAPRVDLLRRSDQQEERCELCGEAIEPRHRHVLDLVNRGLLCACRACSILFDRSAAGGGHYRLVPDRSRLIVDLDLDELQWQAFGIPVDMAFFFRNSALERVAAFYPSPVGATECQLSLDAWADLEARNPVLATMEPDVEALLVNRAKGAREHLIVPVDACYGLVGLIRTHWKGLGGGDEVWVAISKFFAELRQAAEPTTTDGKETTWPGSRSGSRT
jgi:Family of unknown function (DUF5947)